MEERLMVDKTYYERLLQKLHNFTHLGKPADYIPELSRVSGDLLGLSVTYISGKTVFAGDSHIPFTIQSISKALSLLYVLSAFGREYVFERVGMEPTGDAFNSIVRLETFQVKKPLNPMINAGAIVITSLIPGSNNNERISNLLDFIKSIANSTHIRINKDVYLSEKETSTRNRALAWFLKELKVIHGDVEEILDLYFQQCAIEMDAVTLSRIGAFLASDGIPTEKHKRLIPITVAKIVKSLMLTCGMYNASGEFSVTVGLPAKSGVGGGILATVPGRCGIGVFGPALDEKGNSIAGVKVLESLSSELELSIL